MSDLRSGMRSALTLLLATVATGVIAGVSGMALGLLLRIVQRAAFHYGDQSLITHESFLNAVLATSPLQRFLVLCLCGLVAGVGWWALHRYGRPLVSVEEAARDSTRQIHLLSTSADAVLQIVAAGLGSTLGREAAPRELSAAITDYFSRRAGLDTDTRAIMIACAAGAGLAAVYNVPLSGALFTLEVVLGTFALRAVIPALATSVIATVIAWVGLGNAPAYLVPPLRASSSLIWWSVVAGPIFGVAAFLFSLAVRAARTRAPKNWHLVMWSVLVLAALGVLAMYYPQLLGNGKGLEDLGLSNSLNPTLGVVLFLLKALMVVAALRAGVRGGLLTPGLALGGMLGLVLGGVWNHVCPEVPGGAFVIVGSTAFLASSSRMPLTAIALIMEFTRVPADFLVPIVFSVAGSLAVFELCGRMFGEPEAKESRMG